MKQVVKELRRYECRQEAMQTQTSMDLAPKEGSQGDIIHYFKVDIMLNHDFQPFKSTFDPCCKKTCLPDQISDRD